MNKPSILVVDDQPMMREFLKSYLSHDFMVDCKENGAQAIKWLELGNKPSLILADLNMPQLNGYELLDLLKASPRYQGIPVIMLSAKENSEERIKCLSAGAEDYVTKPFNPSELELRVRKQLKAA